MALRIEDYRNIPDWDRFVSEHPCGSLLHSTAMIRSKEATLNNYPYAQVAVDNTGRLHANLELWENPSLCRSIVECTDKTFQRRNCWISEDVKYFYLINMLTGSSLPTRFSTNTVA